MLYWTSSSETAAAGRHHSYCIHVLLLMVICDFEWQSSHSPEDNFQGFSRLIYVIISQ